MPGKSCWANRRWPTVLWRNFEDWNMGVVVELVMFFSRPDCPFPFPWIPCLPQCRAFSTFFLHFLVFLGVTVSCYDEVTRLQSPEICVRELLRQVMWLHVPCAFIVMCPAWHLLFSTKPSSHLLFFLILLLVYTKWNLTSWEYCKAIF